MARYLPDVIYVPGINGLPGAVLAPIDPVDVSNEERAICLAPEPEEEES